MPDVLVVCTANMCRSPMAEGLLRAATPGLSVRSAGCAATGRAATPDAVSAMHRRGVDISGHRPRQLDRRLIEGDGADLIITMERAHVRHVVATDPLAWTRTFTLKELLRGAGALGARPPQTTLADWLAPLSAHRRPTDLMGSSPTDDVADPVGMGAVAYERTADELARAVHDLTNLASF